MVLGYGEEELKIEKNGFKFVADSDQSENQKMISTSLGSCHHGLWMGE